MSNAHALGTPRAPSLIHFVNPLIRRLLGLGLPFGPNVLLTVVGRTSGVPRTFPVAILELDGRRYVQSPFGEVNWVRNLRAAGEAVVVRGGRQEPVRAVELAPEAAGPVFREALVPYLRSRVGAAILVRTFEVRRDSTAEDFVALARRHPMFELVDR
jgi:deazaflavin-dependent oxidoreductase (nitroreductase family)